MESKAVPAWADQEDVDGGAAPDGTARSMGREEWNRRYAVSEFLWTVDANRFLVAEAAGLPPGRALDLATGEGRNAVWLAEQGWDVWAVDFAELGLQKARRLADARGVTGRVSFEVADLRSYRPEPGGFDLVTLTYLQIPQAELQPILLKAAQAVAPGGTFLLVAHDTSNRADGFGGPQDPAVLYTAEEVVTAVEHELVIEKAHTVERLVDTDDGPRVAIDCLVRGRRLP
ncbi:class I SAM-dependent methyltransferase [Thauera sedimentorum]|nr:class I SAM-dependent methyltransferase [Thauera sedimentorum]